MKKEENKRDSMKIVKTVLNVIFWVVLIGLAVIWLLDFIRVQQEKDPMFCISEKTYTYEDGTVEECVGLGYKIYEYNRTSITKGVQFGPFFIKMKE